MSDVRVRSRIAVLALAFAGSGAAGLIAEQSFEKLLGTLLGTSTPASAAVLATYFGGLTLGAWLYGRTSRRTAARAWKTYASLEIAIAIACLVLALSFDRLVPLFVPLLRLAGDNVHVLSLMRLVVAACWILPITIPMGATFPAVVDGLDVLAAEGARRRSAVSAFYATNLIGAIVAAGAGPWLVFPRLGIDRALMLAASLDGVAALVAWEIAAWQRRQPPIAKDAKEEERDPSTAVSIAPLLAVGAVSGFVLFSLEVTWTHLIGTVIGNSVYAFATMLTVVLTGLGLGAAASGFIASRLGRVPAWLPGAALALVWAVLTLLHSRWPLAPHTLAEAGPTTTTFAEAEVARAVVAAKLLFPPTLILGTVYPLLLRLDAFPASSAGWVAARMGAVNALGSIAGALLTGFAIIPAFGAEQTLRLLSVVCLGAGAVVVGRPPRFRAVAAIAAVLGLLVTGLVRPWDRLALTSGEQVYLERSQVFPASRLQFFHEDTHGGFTTVVENSLRGQASHVLLTNGKFQGNDSGEMAAQDGFALVPMLFVDRWEDALVIGLGTGRSAHVARSMRFDRVLAAELAPGIVTAARTEFAHINGRVLDAPNVSLALTDARNHLLLHERTYDLISMEISSVWIAGATNLYSTEFYRLCKSRLKPHGVMQQWVQLHHISLDDIGSAIASMRDSFPYVSLFVAGGQGVLVGTMEPQKSRNEIFVRLAAYGSELGGDPTSLVRWLHSSRLLAPSEVDAFLAAKRPRLNTDKNRLLEYTTPRYALERTLGDANRRALGAYSRSLPQEVGDDVVHELGAIARALAPQP